jgi:hypothetical protein
MSTPILPTSSSAASASARGLDAVAAEACSTAVGSLSTEPGLVVAFTSNLGDGERAAAQLREASGGAPSVGMTGKGIFAANDPIDDGCVAVALDNSIECAIGIGRNASENFHHAGHRAAEEALGQLSEQAGLLMLFVDTRSGDLADAIAGAHEAGPEVPTAGGAASGEHPALYAHGEALADAIVAVALRSPRPVGIGNAFSCSVVGEPLVVTRSEGQEIAEIDGRPAAEVYLSRVGGGGELTDDAFEAMAITHPLAQPEPHGNRRLRHVLGRSSEGGIVCSTQIPEGTAIEFTVLSLDELVRSARDSVNRSVGSLGREEPEAALVFDCAGRRRVLGHGQAQEVKAITESLGHPPALAGLYTNGEVEKVRSAKGDYNHAVVTVTFA